MPSESAGLFAERLHAMRVRAELPDGSLAAELTGRDGVTLTFRPGVYRRMSESEMGRRLAQLARLLWAKRMAEYFRVRSEATGEAVTHESPALGRQDREFQSGRDGLRVEGRSADGRVSIESRGMRDWTVRIGPGTLQTLDEEQFAAEVGQAAAELIADQRDQVRHLAVRVYG